MKRIYSNILLTVVTVMTLVGCSPFEELCWDSDHPHTGWLDVSFKWPGTIEATDSVYMLAIRPLNQHKAGFRVSVNRPNRNIGQRLFDTSDIPSRTDSLHVPVRPTSNEATDYPNNTAFVNRNDIAPIMREGTYNFFCFRKAEQGTTLDDCLQKFRDIPTYRFEDFIVGLSSYNSISEMQSLRPTKSSENWEDWPNHNTYSGYLAPDPKPLFFGTVPDVVVKNNQWTNFTFTPLVNASQTVNFSINVNRKESGIVIDSIKGEVSGAVKWLNPTSQRVLVDSTYRVLFTFNRPDGGWGTGDLAPLRATGTTYVFGLVRGYTDDLLTGPGILTLGIYARVYEPVLDDNGKPMIGSDGQPVTVAYRRVFYATTNLFHKLKADPQVYYDEESGLHYKKGSTHTITIDVPLTLTRKRVEDTEGIEFWKDSGSQTIDMDI